MYLRSGWDLASSESGVGTELCPYVSVCLSIHPTRPCILSTSLSMISTMYISSLRCLLHVSPLWLGLGQFRIGCWYCIVSVCVRLSVHTEKINLDASRITFLSWTENPYAGRVQDKIDVSCVLGPPYNWHYHLILDAFLIILVYNIGS